MVNLHRTYHVTMRSDTGYKIEVLVVARGKDRAEELALVEYPTATIQSAVVSDKVSF